MLMQEAIIKFVGSHKKKKNLTYLGWRLVGAVPVLTTAAVIITCVIMHIHAYVQGLLGKEGFH